MNKEQPKPAPMTLQQLADLLLAEWQNNPDPKSRIKACDEFDRDIKILEDLLKR